jgi:hypothetical protein
MGCRILLSPKLQRWSEALWLATETAALAWLGLFFTVLFRGGKAAWKFALMGMFSLVVGQNGALVSNALLMCSSGVRYFCVCNSFIGFGLVCAWEMRGNVEAKWRVFTGVLIGCLLVSGASDTWFHLKSQTIESNWKMQVAGWRINPSMPLQIPPPIWGGIVLAPYHANANLPVNVYDSDNHPPCTKMKTQAKGTSWLFVRMAGRAR